MSAVEQTKVSVLIPSGASVSAIVHLHAHRVVSFVMPSAWTAANLTIEATDDAATFLPVYSEAGTLIEFVVAANRITILEPLKWRGIQKFRLKSNTAGTTTGVNQGADRIIMLWTART